MRITVLSVLVSLSCVLVGCQAPQAITEAPVPASEAPQPVAAAPVPVTEPQPAAIVSQNESAVATPASAEVWGEVPKQCA